MPFAAAASQHSQSGFDALTLGQQAPRGGADPVMGVGDQRALFVESGRRGQSVDTLPQTGGCQRRVHVDPGQVGGSIAEHGVEVRGAGRGVLRPRRFVPPVAPDRLTGIGRRKVCDQPQAVRQRCRGAQVETGERQPGSGEVDMTVDECGGDEAAGQIDDVGICELVSADVVAAQPDHEAAAHRHCGGVGMAWAVHPAIEQQGGRDLSHADTTYGVRRALIQDASVAGTADRVPQ